MPRQAHRSTTEKTTDQCEQFIKAQGLMNESSCWIGAYKGGPIFWLSKVVQLNQFWLPEFGPAGPVLVSKIGPGRPVLSRPIFPWPGYPPYWIVCVKGCTLVLKLWWSNNEHTSLTASTTWSYYTCPYGSIDIWLHSPAVASVGCCCWFHCTATADL